MTHEAYKEMLALDALNALDGADAETWAAHLAGCADCREELAEWEATASALAYAAPPLDPSPSLRGRILEQIHDEARPGRGSNVIEMPVRAQFGARAFSKLMAIAAAVAFLALLTAVILLWQQNREAKTQVAALSAQLTKLQRSLDRERGILAALTNPGAKINELAGTKDAPNARAVLAFDAKSGAAVLVANGLPPAPQGKAYQLWFMVGSHPVPGRVFNVDATGAAVAHDQVPPEALKSTVFAVTLEPQEGVPAPTGHMYLLSPADHSSLYLDPPLQTTFLS